jgi:Ser/Thr protein kinase RdoA (MazF antagonist)
MHKAAQLAAEAFDLGGRIVEVRPYGRGLIHDTYLVCAEDSNGKRHYAILQRLNRRVFPDPPVLMHNLRVLHAHLASRLRPAPDELRFPAILRTRADGDDLYFDTEGGCWRAQTYLAGTQSLARLTDPVQAAELGYALGRFHALTHDLEPARLRVTRPHFHDTPYYLARLEEVRARIPSISLPTAEARAWLDASLAFVAEHKAEADMLEAARRAGALRLRAVHGDPKLDNVLFDEASGRAVSLIDLDTVQPGLLHHDLGDCLRSCCNPAGESPRDPEEARFDFVLCRAWLERYFAEMRGLLTAADYRYLPMAPRLIAFELGVRFLTDYLEGNRYFKVEWPEHNLLRAATQFHLAADIARQEAALRGLVAELLAPRAR